MTKNSSPKTIVVGLIGPMGGGKSYRLETMRRRACSEGLGFLTGDFSDGIREAVLRIFGASEAGAVLKPSDRNYLEWKKASGKIEFPTVRGDVSCFSYGNRDLLRNTGEYIKEVAGESVWARWTTLRVYKQYWNSAPELRHNSYIVFGSVRFGVEAREIYDFAESINQPVKFVFCNYNKTCYDPNVHVSERLAHTLIKRGYADGDDVTAAVRDILSQS